MENSSKVNLLKYAPENLTVEIMMKYPPKDIIELCKSKDGRIRELCKGFLSRKDYQRMWGGVPYHETYKKEDLEKLEKDVNVIEPNLEILITNLKNQPKDIQKMILMKTKPETLLAVCSIKDKNIARVCCNKDFIEKYASLHNEEELQKLLMSFSKGGEDRDLFLLLTIFGEYVNPSARNNEAIREAALNGHTKVVKVLLKDPRVDPSALNNYAIGYAAYNGYPEVVKVLLEDDRVDPRAGHNYAIASAAKNGHIEVVKLLLKDNRVDPGASNNYAIAAAAEQGYNEIVKLLLKDRRVDPRGDINNSPIITAAKNGHLEIVKLLLKDRRVNPSAHDNEAIRSAAQEGHSEIVKLLLKDHRVDPSADDNFAIAIAAQEGYAEIVKVLLKDDRVDPTEALEYAEANGRENILKLIKKRLKKKKLW